MSSCGVFWGLVLHRKARIAGLTQPSLEKSRSFRQLYTILSIEYKFFYLFSTTFLLS